MFFYIEHTCIRFRPKLYTCYSLVQCTPNIYFEIAVLISDHHKDMKFHAWFIPDVPIRKHLVYAKIFQGHVHGTYSLEIQDYSLSIKEHYS